MKVKPGKFDCEKCGGFSDCPMLVEPVWEEIGGNQNKRLLCYHCAVKILGRPLRFDDLKDCPANRPFVIIFSSFIKKDSLGRALELIEVRKRFPLIFELGLPPWCNSND